MLEHCWSHCLNKKARTLTADYILGVHLRREWGSKAKFCLAPNFHRHLDTASVLCPTGKEEMRNAWKQWLSCGPNPSLWYQGGSDTDFCNNELEPLEDEICTELWNQLTIKMLILLNPILSLLCAVFCLVNSSAKISLQNHWNLLGTGNTLVLYLLALCLLQSTKKDESEKCTASTEFGRNILIAELRSWATEVCQNFMDDFPFAFSNHFPLQYFSSVFPVGKWTWQYLFNKTR